MKSMIGKFFTLEFLRFVVVGVLSAVIEYSLLFLLKDFINYQIANVTAFVITNVFTFTMTRRFVFTSTRSKGEEQRLFIICLAGALLVNHVIFVSLVSFTQLDMRIAKAIAIAVTVVWNFFTRKHIVFRNREIPTEAN